MAATGLVLALLVFGSWVGAAPAGMGSGGLLPEGETAPGFSFADIRTGQVFRLQELHQEQPLLMVFMQTACRSCVREMLALKRMHQQEGSFGVLGVLVDSKDRGLVEYIRDYELTFPFTWDGGYAVAATYGISFTPTSYLIDRNGLVVAVYRGYQLGMEDQIRRDLQALRRAEFRQ